MSSVEIVAYDAEHARDIARLCTTMQWPSLTDSEVVHRICTAPGSSAYVAVEQGSLVGFAQALGDGVLQSHLSFLGVHPDHRRRDIARLLTVATFQSTRTKRMDLITDSAEGFYESFEHKQMLGFRIYPAGLTTVGAPWLAAVMAENIDYLTHVRVESTRFAEVMRDAPPQARVPTCPDWSSDDLLWHLGEVQWFWATIVREGLTDPSSLEGPERPTDRAGLLDFFESATIALEKTLTDTAPDEIRWTWSTEQTAGFTRRRQAHEALIHRIDAELTAGVERTVMDPVLCGDGVDEALRVMFGGTPEWGHTDSEVGATLRISASDIGQSWLVSLGRFTGTDPEGTSHDEPDIVIADTDSGEETAATVNGTAADLDCWLWGRPPVGSLDRSGDEQIHARFQEIVGQGVE